MTNREKAESCGEFVRDGLAALQEYPYRPINGWTIDRECVIEGARQAAHWGRLALADQ